VATAELHVACIPSCEQCSYRNGTRNMKRLQLLVSHSLCCFALLSLSITVYIRITAAVLWKSGTLEYSSYTSVKIQQ
jgi:hypothetical protein